MTDTLRRVLFVDDEKNILEGIERTLFTEDFEVVTAVGGEAGLEAMADEGPFAVIVSDMRMPGMDGATFLKRAKELSPHSVRMLLTGQTDLASAIAAINDGQIFRFLTKPVPTESLIATLETGCEQYRLLTVEKELLEKTLAGTVGVLSEVLGIMSPALVGRAAQMASVVRHVLKKKPLPDAWQFELATMLAPLGCLTLPDELVDKWLQGTPLSESEDAMFRGHPAVAARMIGKIPRMEIVAEMISAQLDQNLATTQAGIDGAVMLALASVVTENAKSASDVHALLKKLESTKEFPPELLALLHDFTPSVSMGDVAKSVTLRELKPSMTADEDVRAGNGNVLITKGTVLTSALIERLENFGKSVGIKEPMRMRAPSVTAPGNRAAA